MPGPLRRLLSGLMPGLSVEEGRAFRAGAVALWALIPVTLAADAILAGALGIGFDAAGLARLSPSLLLVPAALVFMTRRFDPFLASVFGSIAFLGVFAPFLVVFSYLTTAIGGNLPLVDPWLAGLDSLLGFDWPSAAAAVNAAAESLPSLDRALGAAYGSMIFQMVALIVLLSLTGQYGRLQVFLKGYALSVLLVSVIACVLPAVGAYEFYRVDPSLHPKLDLTVRNLHLADYLSLRDGTFTRFSMRTATGIITFPSFHSTMAVLFAWAAWRLPVVRWAALGLNVTMLAATPLYGSHFISDVIAGVVIAPMGLWAATVLRRRAGGWMAPVFGTSRPCREG